MYMDTLPNVRARAAAAAELQERQILGPLISIVTGILDPNDPQTTSTRNTRTVTVTSPRPTFGIPPTTTFNNPFTTRTTPTTTPRLTASQATQLPGTFFTTSTSTFSPPVDPSQNGQTTSTTRKGLPAAVIGIIVAAAVIFGLVFIAIIARKIFQRRRRNKRTTWGGSMISPYEAPLVKEKTNPVAPTTSTPYTYPSAPPVSSLASRNMNTNVPPSAIRNNDFSLGASPYPSFPPPVASFSSGGNPSGNINNTVSYNAPGTAGPATSSFGAPVPYPFNGGAGPSNSNLNNAPKSATFSGGGGNNGLQAQQISVVKRTFVPSLPDELSIANGETVRVLSVYDDGWALCEKMNSGDKGVVPQECLEAVGKPGTPGGQLGGTDTGLKRNSSLREQGNRY